MTDPSFSSILAAAALSRPDEIGLHYPEKQLSWSEIDRLSDQAAGALRSAGVNQDDLVAVALPNCIEHHLVSLAAWKLAATPCILPPKLPNHELLQIVELARPAVIVRSGPPISTDVIQIDPAALCDGAAIRGTLERTARYWKAVASGGSTGRPKLIVDHKEASVGDAFRTMLAMFQIPQGGVLLNPGPLYHNAPFLFTTLAMLAGARVVGMLRFDAEECLKRIEEERVEWVCLVPTMMHRIWSLPAEVRARYDVSSLRHIWHMAAPCAPWLKQAWIDWLGPDVIHELYAGTEAVGGTVITGREWLEKPGSVGRAAPGGITIHRPDGTACAPGEIGDVYFATPAQHGFHYIGTEPHREHADRFSLGDLGHVDADGYLFLADRRTDLMIRGGANIYPAEVEAALEEHPAVAAAVVIGLPCSEYGRRVHALIEPLPQQTASITEINRFVRDRLAGYKCPESYEIASAALRDDAGKVRKASLLDERRGWLDEGRSFQLRPDA